MTDETPSGDDPAPTEPAGDGAHDPHATLREDDYLGPLVAEVGPLHLDTAEDPFERLVVSILRQQVSMASAAATRERLFDAVEVTPAGIRAAEDAVLKDAGLSRQKTRYVNALAESFRERAWDRAAFEAMTDDEVRAALTDVTGVGDWTADMFLLFVLGREDVFPVGDLGVRKGLTNLLAEREHAPGVEAPDPESMNRGDMVEFATRWAPYRSYATLYLWRVEEDVVAGVEEVVTE